MAEAVTKYNSHFGTNLTSLHKKEAEQLTKKEYGKVSSINTLPGGGFQIWFSKYEDPKTACLLQIYFAETKTPAA